MENTIYKEKNLIYLEGYKSNYSSKKNENQFILGDELNIAIMAKVQEIVDTKVEERNRNQNQHNPHILELERKCECMEKKLNKALPYYSIIYMCVNSGIFSVALVLLILRFGFNIYIIDPYYLICAIIISLGLFATAVATLVDWKEYLKKNGKE